MCVCVCVYICMCIYAIDLQELTWIWSHFLPRVNIERTDSGTPSCPPLQEPCVQSRHSSQSLRKSVSKTVA